MKRREFLAMAAALPVLPSVVGTPTLASTHPYMGKPYVSMAISKTLMSDSSTYVLATTKSRAVLIRDIPRKSISGEDMVEVVIPKPDRHDDVYIRKTGLPIGGSYAAESIVDLETSKSIKSRTTYNCDDVGEVVHEHLGEA